MSDISIVQLLVFVSHDGARSGAAVTRIFGGSITSCLQEGKVEVSSTSEELLWWLEPFDLETPIRIGARATV